MTEPTDDGRFAVVDLNLAVVVDPLGEGHVDRHLPTVAVLFQNLRTPQRVAVLQTSRIPQPPVVLPAVVQASNVLESGFRLTRGNQERLTLSKFRSMFR